MEAEPDSSMDQRVKRQNSSHGATLEPSGLVSRSHNINELEVEKWKCILKFEFV